MICPPTPLPGAPPRPIRLLVVDDHRLVRQALVELLRNRAWIEVVGEAEGGLEAVELAQRLRPDVMLMDINMPGLDGVEATRRIHLVQPDIRIIGLSLHQDAFTAREMEKAGATAYISKSDPPERIVAAIRAASPLQNPEPTDL